MNSGDESTSGSHNMNDGAGGEGNMGAGGEGGNPWHSDGCTNKHQGDTCTDHGNTGTCTLDSATTTSLSCHVNNNGNIGGGNHGMNAPAPSNRMNYGDESSSGSGPCTGMEEEVRQAFTHEKLDIIQSNACRDCLQSSENNGCGLVDSDGSLQALANGASNNDNSNDGDGSQYCGPGTSFDAASGQCHATYEGLITACEQERGDWGWTCKNIAEPCDDGK